ncbi:MAG: ROK family protein [Acetobacteraceae bacterium]|nr:ROK family protein [Acetobacteraceae bacterium]
MSDAKQHTIPAHGGADLPSVTVEAYNAELRDAEGFIGDRASRRAFQSILDEWRDRIARVGEDPFGNQPTRKLSKRKLAKTLIEGEVEAAGLILTAIEEFAQELATVCRRLLRLKTWQSAERIVVGGGFRGSRVGELAIGRANVLLKGDGRPIEMRPIRHDPDEAALLGAVHLVPAWMFAGHEAILAVDIGGSNIRAGLVELGSDKTAVGADARVLKFILWRHTDDDPNRDEAVERLVEMLRQLIAHAGRKGHKLAPFVGIGCPGVIARDGAIERGGQNLPGNWESSRFNLPRQIRELLPQIDGHGPLVLLHNDAVVHGLSELPWMQEFQSWGALTIGTGLGNAVFRNKRE